MTFRIILITTLLVLLFTSTVNNSAILNTDNISINEINEHSNEDVKQIIFSFDLFSMLNIQPYSTISIHTKNDLYMGLASLTHKPQPQLPPPKELFFNSL